MACNAVNFGPSSLFPRVELVGASGEVSVPLVSPVFFFHLFMFFLVTTRKFQFSCGNVTALPIPPGERVQALLCAIPPGTHVHVALMCVVCSRVTAPR